MGARLPTENLPRRRGGTKPSWFNCSAIAGTLLHLLMQSLDPRDQLIVITQLRVAEHGTHNLVLTREAAVPMDGDVHILAALFDMHDNAFHQATRIALRSCGVVAGECHRASAA